MNRKRETFSRASMALFRSSAVLLRLSASLMICLGAFSAFAQSQATRSLTLITPEQPDFEAVLSSNFPGIQEFDAYQVVSPFLVVLRNDTSHPAEAYAIMWETRALDGHILRVQNQYIQKHSSPRTESRPFKPGEVRLLSAWFTLSPHQYNVQHDDIARLLSSMASSSKIISQHQFTSVTPTVDAVIYDDGGITGTDRFQLSLRYQCLRDAERDEATSVLQLMEANTPSQAIIDHLRQDAEQAHATKVSPRRRDRASLYALYRGQEAKHFMAVHKVSGDRGLRQRAELGAQIPQKTLTPLLLETPQ
jgi:hypothetical protein